MEPPVFIRRQCVLAGRVRLARGPIELAAMPREVFEHYAAGYERRFTSVISEARTRWPERDAAQDLVDYLSARHPGEEVAG